MLKKDEWTYLLNTRSVSHVRYHFAVVSGVKGVILYPDTYTPSAADAPTVSSGGTVTAADWRKMQLQGCVFLPCTETTDKVFWCLTPTMNGSFQYYIEFRYISQAIRWSSSSSTKTRYTIRLVYTL